MPNDDTDALITLREASALTGRTLGALQQAVNQGRLWATKPAGQSWRSAPWYTTRSALAALDAAPLPRRPDAWGKRSCPRCAGIPCRASLPPEDVDPDDLIAWLLDHEVMAVDLQTGSVTDLRTGRVQRARVGADVRARTVNVRIDNRRACAFTFSRVAAIAALGREAVRGLAVRDLTLGTPPVIALGKHTRKQEWPPCAACHDPMGPTNPRVGNVTPIRVKGERFGFGDGLLCARCYNALRRKERTGRSRMNRQERAYTGGMTLVG